MYMRIVLLLGFMGRYITFFQEGFFPDKGSFLNASLVNFG